jgi:hypothetical protein
MIPEIPEFYHNPPKGYSYKKTFFKKNIIAIWIQNNYNFIYKGNNSVSSIWGFYNTKTKTFYQPINSKSVGKKVDISNTTPYTSMQLNLNPLEILLV